MKKKFLLIGSLFVVVVLLLIGRNNIGFKPEKFTSPLRVSGPSVGVVVSEESVTIDVVKKVSPSVVTIGITKNQPVFEPPFGFFDIPRQQEIREIKQDIGSGFIVKADGLVITNRHVVSDSDAKYRIITSNDKTFDVAKIYRDPENDLAILKIANPPAGGLPAVELGDSDKLQVGQFALAIGTALGEFRSTVTTGVVSGLSRGLSENLSNVIQTSAAINLGNSGGPLLNSAGQVIGVNVAVVSGADNIGFALPINLLKDSLKTFESNGAFGPRAFLGLSYRMVTRDLAVLNEIPEGAYVQGVSADSPAEKAGIVQGDIITKIDGVALRDKDGGLAKIVASKKPGQIVELTIYDSEGKTKAVKATLIEASE